MKARDRIGAPVALAIAMLMLAGATSAQIVSGKIDYSGTLGPIGSQRPLCLCLYADAQLLNGLGCLIYRTNPANFRITGLSAIDYYAVAFVDLHLNERLDADEPFEIYNNRAAPPADAIGGTSQNMHVDFEFGDENLPNAPTPTPTETELTSPTPTETELAAPTPSATPSEPGPTATATSSSPTSTSTPSPQVTPPAAVAGDCDRSGSVGIDELVRAVGIALGTQAIAACPAADVDQDGAVRIAELIQAVNAALR
jgi:hypothetical protein